MKTFFLISIQNFLILFNGFAQSFDNNYNSNINIKIRIPFDKLISINELEKTIPKGEDWNGAWTEVPNPGSGNAYKFLWRRGAINFSIVDNSISINFPIEYQLKVAKRIKKPWPLSGYIWQEFGSCGYNEPMRQVHINLTSKISLKTNLTFDSNTSIKSDFKNKCTVSLLNIDVTDRLKNRLNNILQKHSNSIDQRVESFNSFNTQFSNGIDFLKLPIDIKENNSSLIVKPNEFVLSPVVFKNDELEFNIIAKSEFLIVSNDLREKYLSSIKSSPIYSLGTDNVSSDIFVKIQLSYQNLSDIISLKFLNKEYKILGNNIKVDSVSLMKQDDKLLCKMTVSGWKNGVVILKGLPKIDIPNAIIYFTNINIKLNFGDTITAASQAQLENLLVESYQDQMKFSLANLTNDINNILQESNNIKVNNFHVTSKVNSGKIIEIFLQNDSATAVYSNRGVFEFKVK